MSGAFERPSWPGRTLDPDDISKCVGPDGVENPVWVAMMWVGNIRAGISLDMTAMLVTPESRHLWSPMFESERVLLSGSKTGVCYEPKYVSPTLCSVAVTDCIDDTVRRTLVITLQFRPDCATGGWRVHHLGPRGLLHETDLVSSR